MSVRIFHWRIGPLSYPISCIRQASTVNEGHVQHFNKTIVKQFGHQELVDLSWQDFEGITLLSVGAQVDKILDGQRRGQWSSDTNADA